MLLLFILLLPLLGAALPPLVAHWGRDAAPLAAAVFSSIALALLFILARHTFDGAPPELLLPWVPALGLELALRLDGLGFLFAFIILGIGLLIIFYARYYFPAEKRLGRFYGLLLLFQAAMLGVVLSDNLLLLATFWELTSVSSFLLIGYGFRAAEARRGARIALAVTGAGGFAMLAGFLMLGHMAGTYRISELLALGETVRAHPWYVPMLLLVLAGAFTKSAQFPFHFWLPGAMAAPTPVSAYLHSATMVKAGVFLLARLFPVLSGTDTWFFIVGTAGLVTLLYAAYLALFQHDLKGLLAYSTVSHLGLITLLFGFGTPLGAVAGIFHVINHAIFKASLFMAAGIIDHETGSRDMRRINGLWKYMPHTALLAMVAAASMAGVPLLNGFLSKEMFFAEAVHQEWLGAVNWVLPALATLAGAFAVAYSLRFIHDVFFNGEPVDLPIMPPHEPPRWMKIPIEVLVTLCILVGVLPAFVIKPLLDVAAAGVLGAVPHYDLAVWHGISPPLIMSLVALLGGTLVYTARRWVFMFHDRIPLVDGSVIFERIMAGVYAAAQALNAAMDNGRLRRYVGAVIVIALLLGMAPFLSGRALLGDLSFTAVDGVTVVAALMLAVGAIASVLFHEQRLVVIIMLGVVGLVITLAFVHFSAPDLALTQITVEVVTTVLLLLALFFLPGGAGDREPRMRHWGDGVLAVLAGTGVAALVLGVLTRPYETIAGYYLANAKPIGGGDNVVNVILVDFRGFDTLGEITVLAIAATGIYAMLRGLGLGLPQTDTVGRDWSSERHPLFLAILSRPLLPLALLVAIYILLRGHNAPGGGFIAGLIAGTALILQYLASGIEWTQARLRLRYFQVAGAGLLIAALTGAAAIAVGRPYLTSGLLHLELPIIGELELASAMAFDLGVFFAVLGVVIIVLAHLGRLSRLDVPTPLETPEEAR
jgi:multicomponent K+:H+ antiporter subunit A